MADSKHPDDKEYNGPGAFTAAMGRGSTEAAVLGAIGLVTGVTVGALIKTKLPLGAARNTIEGWGSVPRWILSSSERGLGGLIGGTIGGAVGTLGGAAHGIYRGTVNVEAAQKQVYKLSGERDKAEEKFALQETFIKRLEAAQNKATDKTDPDKTPAPGR